MLPFLLLFPILTFTSLAYGFWLRYHRRSVPAPIRMSLLSSGLLWAALLITITEATNYYLVLTASGLTTSWAISSLGSGIWAYSQYESTNRPALLKWSTLTKVERFWLISTGLVLLLTLLTGLVYPPNNNDSLSYHMGRVAHWIQQHNLRPFATHIERELYQPPLAEWIILHLYLLTGSDLLANTVQWFLGTGCLIAVSVLTKQVGGSRAIQLAAAFVAATVPMVVLQMSSTQNDVVVSFYLIMLAISLVQLYQNKLSIYVLWAGISLGSAWLTKGTAYLFAAPILLSWGLMEIRRLINNAHWLLLLKLAASAVVLVCLALLLNSGQYERNLSVYGHPLTNEQEQSLYTNQLHSPTALLSNIVRNTGIHFGVPGVHWLAQYSIENIHRLLGLAIDDSRTSYFGMPFHLPRLSNNEDNASNFLHTVGLVCCLVWLVVVRHNHKNLPLMLLTGTVGVMFLLFCAYLKWQPWHSRLQTPLFLLAAPLGGYGLVAISRRFPYSPSCLLLASALCFALMNFSRPLISIPPLTVRASWLNPRSANYYINNQSLLPIHTAIAQFINRQSTAYPVRVGMMCHEWDWDYVWFQQFNASVRLYHINVTGSSHRLDLHPSVDYILSTLTNDSTLTYNGKLFRRLKLTQNQVFLYAPINQITR